METKLVTVYLNDYHHGMLDARRPHHGDTEEILSDYFADGWTVKTILSVGSSVGSGGNIRSPNDEGAIKGWIVVQLER